MNETSYQTPATAAVSIKTSKANQQPAPPVQQETFLATTIQFQRAVAQRVAQRAQGAEVLSPGDWLRRVGGLQAPFGFDGMPTVLG